MSTPLQVVGALPFHPTFSEVLPLDGQVAPLGARAAAALQRRRGGADAAPIRAAFLSERARAEEALASSAERGLRLVLAHARLAGLRQLPGPDLDAPPAGGCPAATVPLAGGRLKVGAPDADSGHGVLAAADRTARRRFGEALKRRLGAEPHAQALLVAPPVRAQLESDLQDDIDALATPFAQAAAAPLEQMLVLDRMLEMTEVYPPQRVLLVPRVQPNRQFRLWPRCVCLLASAEPMRLGTAWSWLWWRFVFVLPDGSR
jgi:hypothetical protein